MKQQKKFWIRENQSIGIWTFLGCLLACANLASFQSDIHDAWRNFYFVEQFQLNPEYSVYARFISECSVFYPAMIFFVLVVSILLFHNLNKNNTKEWIASMPLKQKDIFWYKFKQGMVAYTLPILVFAAGSIGMMIVNRGWLVTNYMRYANCRMYIANENPLVYGKALLMMWGWLTAVYMIFFFAQVICRNCVLAGLIGYGMVSASGYLGSCLFMVAGSYHMEGIKKIAFLFYRSFEHIFMGMPGEGEVLASFFDLFGIFASFRNDIGAYKIYLPEIAIMVGTFVLFFALSRYYYRRMNHPEVEGLFVSKLMRAFVLYGFGFCMMFPVVFLSVDVMELPITLLNLNVIVGAIPALLIHFLLKRRGY